MSSSTGQRVRHALVGTGSRAEMFVRALVRDHADTAELVAFADVNQARMDAHNRWLGELGHPPVPTYAADDLATMLAKERVDVAAGDQRGRHPRRAHRQRRCGPAAT